MLASIRNLFIPLEKPEHEIIVPAPPTTYLIRPLTIKDSNEVQKLNIRCFRNGEYYTKHTFNYLLNAPEGLAYRAVTAEGFMAGFILIMIKPEGAAHLTTIGVAPEHRRRNLAKKLLIHLEDALLSKEINTIMLEVRVGNTSAQSLYKSVGYAIVQRMSKYYHNGEDGFLMIKSLT